MDETLLLTRIEAAATLRLSVSTLDMLVARGMLRARRQGRRVFVERIEIERFAHRDHALWPPKRDGKTTRWYAAESTQS